MRDFSLRQYRVLLQTFKKCGYSFVTFQQALSGFKNSPYVILRHDVDARPLNSLIFANIQNKEEIKGTYYFRAVPSSWDEEVIKSIHAMGHEIGYHYENMSMFKGDKGKSIKDFELNLKKLREICPVSTICMHGSPMSRYDARSLWKYFDYGEYGILGEPYFDLDLSSILYMTDTGRRWDGNKVSLRDKAIMNQQGNQNIGWKRLPSLNSSLNPSSKAIKLQQSYSFRSSNDIVFALENGKFPENAMLTFHPQRWTDNRYQWFTELIMQNFKNLAKLIWANYQK